MRAPGEGSFLGERTPIHSLINHLRGVFSGGPLQSPQCGLGGGNKKIIKNPPPGPPGAPRNLILTKGVPARTIRRPGSGGPQTFYPPFFPPRAENRRTRAFFFFFRSQSPLPRVRWPGFWAPLKKAPARACGVSNVYLKWEKLRKKLIMPRTAHRPGGHKIPIRNTSEQGAPPIAKKRSFWSSASVGGFKIPPSDPAGWSPNSFFAFFCQNRRVGGTIFCFFFLLFFSRFRPKSTCKQYPVCRPPLRLPSPKITQTPNHPHTQSQQNSPPPPPSGPPPSSNPTLSGVFFFNRRCQTSFNLHWPRIFSPLFFFFGQKQKS